MTKLGWTIAIAFCIAFWVSFFGVGIVIGFELANDEGLEECRDDATMLLTECRRNGYATGEGVECRCSR